MLSQDLSSLARMTFLAMDGDNLKDMKNSMLMLAERIQEASSQAAYLEAARVETGLGVEAKPVLIDLSDDKIALFPGLKRPAPSAPKDGDVA
ncbi:hypothetical protein [Roseibium sp.]|uniref:hypothetical protein n=1 Tax=Roseibium sp. TaxID=1936156 RepID=UPI003A980F77